MLLIVLVYLIIKSTITGNILFTFTTPNVHIFIPILCFYFRCSQVLLDSGVTERILSKTEHPLNIMKQMGKDSIRQMELMRFYMQHSQDPHGPNIALFVGNLDPGKSQRKYEDFLNKYLNEDSRFTSIGPIYYEYGSVVLTYEDAQKAVSLIQ